MNKQCFIICPIGAEGSEIRKRSDTVFDYFLKPICEKMDYNIVRSDKITSTDRIDSEIIKYLDSSELVIADLTDFNPNVFYEVGYRKAKGLPCLHIALEGTDLPFDVTTIRTYFYSISDIPKSESFKENLKSAISNIEIRAKNNETDVVAENDSSFIEQEILDRIYNLEDSIQSFYDMIEKSLVDIDMHIEECSQNNSSDESALMQTLMSTFLKEGMKNPANAKRFISQFQNSNDDIKRK